MATLPLTDRMVTVSCAVPANPALNVSERFACATEPPRHFVLTVVDGREVLAHRQRRALAAGSGYCLVDRHRRQGSGRPVGQLVRDPGDAAQPDDGYKQREHDVASPVRVRPAAPGLSAPGLAAARLVRPRAWRDAIALRRRRHCGPGSIGRRLPEGRARSGNGAVCASRH